MSLFKRFTAMGLCSLMICLPAMSQPAAGNQVAGQINALIPAATRNSQTAKVKEELDWNDLLKTENTGRVRAGLKDGSILSVGSDSELRIVQHDTTSQQTELEMDFGKVRSQVTKVTKAGGKFEMKTPNAVIGVIGTDFYTSFEANKTTVICYKGKVTVTPIGGAQATNNSGSSSSTSNAISVAAGQMVVITSEIPPAGFQATNTPPDVLEASLFSTSVKAEGSPAHHGHLVRNVLIASGLAAGLGLGLYFGTRGSGGTPTCKPGSPACN
ncbi:MAG: FecR family protein [Candidatus Acidiferrales bacterium]